MAGRSRDTYKKRQKEVARAEKQREKAARRLDRKLHKNDPETGEVVDASEDIEDLDHLDRLDLEDLDKEIAGIRPLREGAIPRTRNQRHPWQRFLAVVARFQYRTRVRMVPGTLSSLRFTCSDSARSRVSTSITT